MRLVTILIAFLFPLLGVEARAAEKHELSGVFCHNSDVAATLASRLSRADSSGIEQVQRQLALMKDKFPVKTVFAFAHMNLVGEPMCACGTKEVVLLNDGKEVYGSVLDVEEYVPDFLSGSNFKHIRTFAFVGGSKPVCETAMTPEIRASKE